MDLNRLARRAKDVVEKRGGMQGLMEDAGHLREIAGQRGSMAEKAKQAVETLRRPPTTRGKAGGGAQAGQEPTATRTAGAGIPGDTQVSQVPGSGAAEGPEVVREAEIGQPPPDAEVVQTDEVHTSEEVQTAAEVQTVEGVKSGEGVHTAQEVQTDADRDQAQA